MKMLEFGNHLHKKLLLIHGMQVPWQVWQPQIDHFSQHYCVIVPILDGHNPTEPSTFSSIETEAEAIEKQFIEQYGDELFAICGMSMGGSIASVLWTRGNLRINKLFLEGAPLVPQSKLLTSIITKEYINLTHKTKQRDPKTLNKCEKTFIPKKYMPYFLEMMDAISDETITNCVTSAGQFRLPESPKRGKIDIIYYHGTTLNELLSKKSAKYLKKYYPNTIIKCLNGYSHCQLVLQYPEEHKRLLEEFLRDKEQKRKRPV